jgi:ABC-2 type transport system ATP-binding protein
MWAIETVQLQKYYRGKEGKDVQAVAGVDLTVPRGEIYALLGPNGAGKTTTISMLATLLLPSAGYARVAGFDVVAQPGEVRRRIGVTFQEIVLDQELTGRQVLDFHGRLYGQPRSQRHARIAELAQLVELSDALDRRSGQYSGGMKRRLELARGLMTGPMILFLDEPTQGLDPQNRANIWAYIRRLRAESGLTLLLTTHYMEEAEALADRVGIMDHGRLVVEGTPGELVRRMGADVIMIHAGGAAGPFVEQARRLPFVSQVTTYPDQEGGQIQLGVDSGDRRLAGLIDLAGQTGLRISEVSVAKPTLADVFLQHTGRALRDA